jgi:tetratricopeptide (TPR) repeat protein
MKKSLTNNLTRKHFCQSWWENSIVIPTLLFLNLTVLAGCSQDSGPPPTVIKSRVNSIDLALAKLERIDRGEETLAIPPLVYDLNRWSEQLPSETISAWKEDSLLGTLPKQLRDNQVVADIQKSTFDNSDGYYIREAVWLHELANWISVRPIDGPYELGVPNLSADGKPGEREELTAALRLFDWTVRNITMDNSLPNELADLSVELSRVQLSSGTTQLPWQAILSGRAGAWTRARVFMLLARQLGIDTCVLAIEDPAKTPNPFPWVIAVFVSDQPDESPFLFDPVLGLPLFDEQGKFITLAQLQADLKFLELYSVGSLKYTVGAADLKSVVALIDAAPQAISPRIRGFEQELVGETLSLSVDTEQIAKKAKSLSEVKSVQLWTAPIIAEQVFAALEKKNPQWTADDLLAVALRRGIYASQNPLVRGRIDHIHGKFDLGEDRQSGAKFWYMESRVPDRTLKRLPDSPALQREFGIEKTEQMTDEVWKFQLDFQLKILRRLKLNGTYFLGLVHYENGQYDVARHWWDDQLENDEDVWRSAVDYQIARCYEAEGDLAKARELLIATEESPLQLGNFVRSRWLRLREEAAD